MQLIELCVLRVCCVLCVYVVCGVHVHTRRLFALSNSFCASYPIMFILRRVMCVYIIAIAMGMLRYGLYGICGFPMSSSYFFVVYHRFV